MGARDGDTLTIPEEEQLSFAKRIKKKSAKIVEESKRGETKQKIAKCKKSLSCVGAGDFSFKLHFDTAKDIESVEKFHEIIENIGKQQKLPELKVEEMKLSAYSSSRVITSFNFECAMTEGGAVRLSMVSYETRRHGEHIDFRIALNYEDLSNITVTRLPIGLQHHLRQLI